MIENSYLYLWGKKEKDEKGGKWHSLMWHLIDTGNVARLIWENHLSNSFKQHLCRIFSLSETETKQLLVFWVSLHDIGKAGPAFQCKSPDHFRILSEAGLRFPHNPTPTKGTHSLATTWIIRTHLQKQYQYNIPFTNHIAISLGGHHGEFPLNEEILQTAYQNDHLGDGDWQALQLQLIQECEHFFNPPHLLNLPTDRRAFNTISMLLAGLTTTADWIASNEKYFPFVGACLEPKPYFEQSLMQAGKALKALGWSGWEPDSQPLGFSQLFPDKQANPMQASFFEATSTIRSPYLIILEASTGIGKTEAALWLTDHTLQTEKKGGLYIAMPTQATSNQMFERTAVFLKQRYPNDGIKPRLVHGAALLNEFFEEMNLTAINQDNTDVYASLTSQDWFLPKKRTLLANFGIGTVDQTFMAVLRARHFFMRLFGLSHKVVIFDEVHAYDVFMLEIFKRLISWLHMVNASVILLTATLPQSSRQDLVETYFNEPKELPQTCFPRATICSQDGVDVISLPKTENRTIAIDWLEDEDILPYLQEKLADGGNAAIIGNRVKRVQDLYERIIRFFPEDEVILFHSQYPLCWRSEIEKTVVSRYGKNNPSRPKRSIVIATQVIEQSLDLDFDLLISDIAPVDLIIQRIGRLHRHPIPAGEISRPQRLHNPTTALIKPEMDNKGLPNFGKDIHVYKQYVLGRTHFCLQGRTGLVLPEQSDELIECVYSQTRHPCIPDDLWLELQKHLDEMLEKNTREELKALNQLIPAPDNQVLGRNSATFRDENDPISHNIVRAVTRNARPSVQLVCLNQKGDCLYTLADDVRMDLTEKPNAEAAKSCLRSSLSIDNPQIVDFFLQQSSPPGWQKSAYLRTHFAAIFKDDVCQCGSSQLRLDRVRGLMIDHQS